MQIIFVIPAEAGPGTATVSISSLTAQVDIVAIAPVLCTENAAGVAGATTNSVHITIQ